MWKLSITIPGAEFFKDGTMAANCLLNGERVVAAVSIIRIGEEIKNPTTKRVSTLPTLFSIAVEGYVTRIYSGHFGDEAELEMTRKTRIPEAPPKFTPPKIKVEPPKVAVPKVNIPNKVVVPKAEVNLPKVAVPEVKIPKTN